MTDSGTADLRARYDARYEQYGRPLEGALAGKFLAISTDGRTVVADTRHETAARAHAELGDGVFLYRIGERSVGRWR